jgi:threonyl-tRNA synthetase
MEQAKQEFASQIELCRKCMEAFELDYEVAVRYLRDFRDQNREFADRLIELCGVPQLIELWNERFFYFVAKLEFNFVDALDKASCLSTIQIDVENCERFDINYIDEQGEKIHPLLLHTSISGSIDRVLYAILESQAIRMKKGQKASFPLWLAPSQVRLVPVSEQFNEYCEKLMPALGCRVDLDDRDLTVGRKIREAEREWVPFVAVIGERERSSDTLNVRARDGSQQEMKAAELAGTIREKTAGKPFKPLNLPDHLSVRPVFVG